MKTVIFNLLTLFIIYNWVIIGHNLVIIDRRRYGGDLGLLGGDLLGGLRRGDLDLDLDLGFEGRLMGGDPLLGGGGLKKNVGDLKIFTDQVEIKQL
jgi:hypothetical protein